MNELINRQGIDAYCQNIIVNAIENMGNDLGYRIDNEDYTLILERVEGKLYATVRMYTKDTGWYTYSEGAR